MTALQTPPAGYPAGYPGSHPVSNSQLAARHTLDLRGHRRLRGPYTAGGALLRHVVPELMAVDPDLVKPAATAVVAIAPDLEGEAPTRPQTLTDLARGDERTRFYAVQRTRNLAFMVSRLVNVWARVCHPEGVTLRFWELAEADPTDAQLFATLRRRCDPTSLDVLDAGPLDPALRGGGSADPAQRYVDADGTSTDPTELAAYQALTDADRTARHSRRGQLLIDAAAPGSRLGAIPYHLERGEEPGQALEWLVEGQNRTFREGFYAAALDLGRRGRALLNWSDDPKTHNYLTKRVIAGLTYLGRCDEAVKVIDEHRLTTTEVAEQMNDAYMMAMIYTRHLPPDQIDQDLALAWINTALALAEGAPTPEKHAFYTAFMRNARALVELHRGNLAGSLDLVNQAIGIADEHLGDEDHKLHRTVLLNNRARVLLKLGDFDGAIAAFNEVLDRDPEYEEPYFDRAVAHKAHGDLDAALRDLDRAVELSVAFTDAYYNRADILLDLGAEEAALANLDTVLDIDPDYLEALLNRAAIHLGFGELEAAAADIAHGLSLDPEHAHLWSAKGLLRSEQGALDEALDCFAAALDLNPKLVEAYGNRAVLHFGAGRVAAAVADLDAAIALTDTAALRVNRGIGRHELGDPAAAVEDFDAALAMPDADEATVLYHRGRSHRTLGQHDRADADWDRHLHLVAEQGEVSPYVDEIAGLRTGPR
jgi:tetratricopeptide (TPR) repeat protein